MECLLEKAGFKIVELSTPGELDVNIVENTITENPGIAISRFARQILRQPERVKKAFQAFLSSNQLSSHVRVVAQCLP